jgi:hypothetical protein
MLVVGAIFVVSGWPWLLGTHIAQKHGEVKGSAAYNLAGWIPEAAWIVLVVGGVVLAARRANRRDALRARQREAAARAAAEAARLQEAAAEQRLTQMRQADAEAAQLRWAAAEQQRLALTERRAQMRLVDTPWYDTEFGHYKHSTCTIQHRSEGSALRCKSKV